MSIYTPLVLAHFRESTVVFNACNMDMRTEDTDTDTKKIKTQKKIELQLCSMHVIWTCTDTYYSLDLENTCAQRTLTRTQKKTHKKKGLENTCAQRLTRTQKNKNTKKK